MKYFGESIVFKGAKLPFLCINTQASKKFFKKCIKIMKKKDTLNYMLGCACKEKKENKEMELSKLTKESLITIHSDLVNKDEIIHALIEKLYQEDKISNKEEFYNAVIAREEISATGIDAGLAIPHGKSSAVKEASFAVAILNNIATDWPSVVPTNEVKYVFLLAIPEVDESGTQMKLLSTLMTKMSDMNYTSKLYSATSPKQFVELLDYDPNQTTEKEEVTYTHSIVAITACAAGIAHTYMAAEALIKAGKEMGVQVFVEKQGANGIEDRHTNEQLKNADAAIFSVDVAVKNEERYQHLPTIRTRVAAPLHNAQGIIQDALDKASNSDKKEFVEQDAVDESITGIIKESVMTGISHVIPLIVAGGMIAALVTIFARLFGAEVLLSDSTSYLYQIKLLGSTLLGTLMVPVLAAYMAYSIAEKPGLTAGFAAGLCANMIEGGFLAGMLGGIVAGFVMLGLKKYIPAKGTFAGFVSFVIYPVASVLIVGIIMLFVLGQPVTWLNNSLVAMLSSLSGTNAALLGAIVGIMVSFDLGGPVNKASYAFCVAAMAEGVLVPYCVFASVKMVSAFAVTLATKFAKDLYTEQEREIGNSTWLLGLAGITEGAIPFMMADPLRVMFSMSVGSAVCGALVAMFQIGLDVPGAGIFSIFVLTADNMPVAMAVWFGAAVLGAIISASLLVITRKQKLKK